MNHAIRTSLAALGALALGACGSGTGAPAPSPGALRTSRGAITAKGSLTVNGVRWDATGAAIRIEDSPGHAESELHLGMVVKVRGRHDGRAGQAVEVEFEDDLRGKIDGKGPSSLRVGGHEVEVDEATEFEDPVNRLDSVSPGERVRVSGFPRASGAIRASRVEKLPGASDDFEVKGFVSDLSGTGFTLKVTPDAAAGYAVTLAAGVPLPAGIQNGSYVEVRSASAPAGGAITASAVELEDARLGGENDEVEVEGIVTSGSSASFVVAGQAVATGASTTWENGGPEDLLPGVKVEAEGRLDASGTLVATKVSYRASVRLQHAVANLVAQDARNGTFELLGITVHANDLTEFKDDGGNPVDLGNLGPGPVLVRAIPHRNGTDVVATRVEKTNDDRPMIQGVLAAHDAGMGLLAVLGVTVDASQAEAFRDVHDAAILPGDFFAALEDGRTVVKARGRDPASFSGTTLVAKEVEIEGSR